MISDTGALDSVFRRAGDDLFRLAALLTPDLAQASQALQRAVRDLSHTPGAPVDERRLLAALLATLPAAPRRARTPAWARVPDAPATQALLTDLAQLPLEQRLALGLGALRALEPVLDDASHTDLPTTPPSPADHGRPRRPLALDAAMLRASRSAALLTLARHALPPGQTLPPLVGEQVPEACRPARATLADSTAATHEDPAIRGHLALCAECRAAAQAWRAVALRVEEALRAALRDIQPPPGFAELIRAAALPAQRQPLRSRLNRSLAWRALVPLLVLLAIGALVWPRAQQAALPADPSRAAQKPADLVQRALDQLYAAPQAAGQGVWQARYAIRWFFADASYADLEGTLWLDTARGRHRVQLVHEAGGGPFELQLGDGRGTLWYGVEPRYAASLYPQLSDRFDSKVELTLPPAEQRAMLQARLGAGAWALPAAYLRQAAASAELRSWGRRTADDGADLAVISFRGTSMLGPPSGAADAGAQVTVLLAIDTASGRLYEVRELVGPDAGEQTGRMVWRFLGGQWVGATAAVEQAFDPALALNFRGDFAMLPQGVAAPELPIIPAGAVQPLAGALDRRRTQPLLPESAPPGVTSAALIAGGAGRGAATVFYLGVGRRLSIRAVQPTGSATSFPRTAATEEVEVGSGTALLRPGPAQRYEVFVDALTGAAGGQYLARISAQGFSRDEMLGVLRSLAPLSIETVRRQSALFIGSQAQDRAAFDALLGALATAPAPAANVVQYRAETIFERHMPFNSGLADPYHLRPYGGRPELLTRETWTRMVDGAPERASLTRSADGTVFERSYAGPSGAWSQDIPRSEVHIFRFSPRVRLADQGADAAEQLLICGATLTRDAAGARVALRSEPGWRSGSCALPNYVDLIEAQSAVVLQRSDGGLVTAYAPQEALDAAPFLADLPDTSLATRLWFGPQGRVVRSEVSVATAQGGGDPAVLERWELARDEPLPAASVPADVFRPGPPAALMRVLVGQAGDVVSTSLVPLDLQQARALLGSALYTLAPQTAPVGQGAVPPLMAITGSTFASEGVYSSLPSFDDPFEDALYYAAALRVELQLPDPAQGRQRALAIYQGNADRFGAYLRARVRWRASEPLRVTLDGREIDAWLVTTLAGRRWALAESGGTLLAVPADRPEQLAILGQLTRA